MAGLLIEARAAAAAARRADQSALEPAVLEDLLTRPRALTGAGLTANLYRRTATAKDACRLARRFRTFEDLILRFATRPDLDTFTNNRAERTIRPVQGQQRGSGRRLAPSTGSLTSPSSSPTYPPPPNGASPNSTPSATCSTATPGNHPDLNPPDNRQRPGTRHITPLTLGE